MYFFTKQRNFMPTKINNFTLFFYSLSLDELVSSGYCNVLLLSMKILVTVLKDAYAKTLS